MQDADPESFAKMVKLYNTCGPRPVKFCTAAIAVDEATKAGKESAKTLPRPPAPPGRR